MEITIVIYQLVACVNCEFQIWAFGQIAYNMAINMLDLKPKDVGEVI